MRACGVLLLAVLAVSSVAGGDQEPKSHGKQLIMLEIERLSYPGEAPTAPVKRQAQVQYGGAPGQFVVRTSDPATPQQEVPPEYLSLLQQLSPQQGQQQQHDIQQVFITRNPQESYAEFSQQPAPAIPVPGPPRLTPEQQQMRRLQEEQANKHIREQQERALQRALQTGQFQTGFQPQPYQPQQQQQTFQSQQLQRFQQPQQQRYQQPQPQSLSFDSSAYVPQPIYEQPPPAPQFIQQTRSIRPTQVPKTFSYSQVEFGNSAADQARENLEPRLNAIEQKLQSQAKAVQPQFYSPQPSPPPQPQQQYQPRPQPQQQPQYQPQPQQEPQYQPQPQQQPQYQPQPQPQQQYQPQPQPQQDYSAFVQPQQQTPTQPQHPEQYLIETTRPAQNPPPSPVEQVVRIPRPRPQPPQTPPARSLFYRPQPVYKPEPYTTIPGHYYRQYTPAPQYAARPQQVPLPSPDAPSRSAYYVQQSGVRQRNPSVQQPSPFNQFPPGYTPIPRVPTPKGQRPLTAAEIKALTKAGFQVSPLTLNSLQEPSEISPSYDEEGDADRAPNAKRQSQYLDERKPPGKYPKRIPKPVPLTDTERRMLAQQGIRNLYRVESAESKDAPVTYVLAIDNDVMMRATAASTLEKN